MRRIHFHKNLLREVELLNICEHLRTVIQPCLLQQVSVCFMKLDVTQSCGIPKIISNLMIRRIFWCAS